MENNVRGKNIVAFTLIMLFIFAMSGCGKKENANYISANTVTNRDNSVTEISNNEDGQKDNENVDEDIFIVPANYISILEININPKLNLYLDSDNVVLAIDYLNEDARVAYADRETDLIGSTLETATSIVIDEAVEQGYLTKDKEVSFDLIACEREDSAFSHNLLLTAYETAECSMAEYEMEIVINTKIADERVSFEDITATQTTDALSGNTSEQGNESTKHPSTPAPTPVPTATPTLQPSTAPAQTETTQPTPCPAGTTGCPTCQGHQVCPNCHGAKTYTCNMCGGSGQHACPACSGSGLQPDGVSTCPECNGNGMSCFICHGTGNETCNYCNGSGLCWTCGGVGHL